MTHEVSRSDQGGSPNLSRGIWHYLTGGTQNQRPPSPVVTPGHVGRVVVSLWNEFQLNKKGLDDLKLELVGLEMNGADKQQIDEMQMDVSAQAMLIRDALNMFGHQLSSAQRREMREAVQDALHSTTSV